MPGKVALGPLDENAATLGGSTPLPVTLTVGNILTNGFRRPAMLLMSLCATARVSHSIYWPHRSSWPQLPRAGLSVMAPAVRRPCLLQLLEIRERERNVRMKE